MQSLTRAITAVASVTCSMAVFAADLRAAPDKILYNAEIITMDPARPRAQAIAIRGNTILAVGSNSEMSRLRSPRTVMTNLGGRTVFPGLIDSHIHAIRGGQGFTFETYWYQQTSLGGAIGQLRQEALRRGTGKWVAVTGAWHPEQFTEKRAPTVQELSAAMPDNPAYVQYLYDYALVNDKAIEVLGLNTGGVLPAGVTVERDPQGKASGRLTGGIGPFSALFARLSARSDTENRDSLKAFFGELNQQGVTGIVDAAAGDYAIYSPLFKLWQDKALTLRVAYRSSAAAPGGEAAAFQSILTYMPPLFGDDMLKYLGMGEALVFGMNDGVRMGPGFSPTPAARQELAKVAALAADRRYPLEVHAYTNDAAKAILDVFEEVAQTRPIKDLRWAITHINTGSEETFERMRKLGLAYTVQMGPYFEGPAIREANGEVAAQASPPTRLALSKGIMVAGGTDSTRIGVVNVWRAIEYHISGRSVGGALQRRADYLLSREEALKLYTANAAWVTFDEQVRGTLAPGKLADIAVLNAPYLRMPVDQIHTIRSVMTLVNGQVVYQDAAALAPALAPLALGRGKQAVRQAGPGPQVLRAVAFMQQAEERQE
ncbi:MAG: putative Metallo-dependent hydrolase [Polaromonas sp.]|nr:putative Metallo-dependent hydrolase [Polaromonas sp.]